MFAPNSFSSPKTEKPPPNSTSSYISAKTPKKSYHTPSAESCYPKAPKLRDLSSSESSVQTPASKPKPPAAPETPQTDSARPPAKPPLAPPQLDRLAQQTATGPQLRKKAAPPARQLPAKN